MTVPSTAPDEAAPATAVELELLRAMAVIRFFEEECHRLFSAASCGAHPPLSGPGGGGGRRLRGAPTGHDGLHLPGPRRGAGQGSADGPLVRGDPRQGRGLCGGKGGSMHLTDMSVGAIGSFAIIGAHLPIIVGVAFAAQYKGHRRRQPVLLRRRRDQHRRVSRGAEHGLDVEGSRRSSCARTTCTASTRRSPRPPRSTRLVGPRRLLRDAGRRDRRQRHRRGARHGRRGCRRGRAGEGPTLIEALTYRQKGHSRTTRRLPARGRARAMARA